MSECLDYKTIKEKVLEHSWEVEVSHWRKQNSWTFSDSLTVCFRASAACSARWRWSGCSAWVESPASWITTLSTGQLCWCCWCAFSDWLPTGWPASGELSLYGLITAGAAYTLWTHSMNQHHCQEWWKHFSRVLHLPSVRVAQPGFLFDATDTRAGYCNEVIDQLINALIRCYFLVDALFFPPIKAVCFFHTLKEKLPVGFQRISCPHSYANIWSAGLQRLIRSLTRQEAGGQARWMFPSQTTLDLLCL